MRLERVFKALRELGLLTEIFEGGGMWLSREFGGFEINPKYLES